MRCEDGYHLPNGQYEIELICERNKWKVGNINSSTEKEILCSPICRFKCENNSTCEAPDTCKCLENHIGPQCRYLRCHDPPTNVKNADPQFR